MDNERGSEERDRRQIDPSDIRTIIGSLMGIYGVILILVGAFADPPTGKVAGNTVNLLAGAALLILGVAFIAWALVRPVSMPAPETR